MHTEPAIDAPRNRGGKARLRTLDDLDGRTSAARYARLMVSNLVADLGGPSQISEGMRQLVQRAAVLGALVQDFEARWIAGEKIALEAYLSAVNVQRRVLATIGLDRRARNITPLEYARTRERQEARA